VSKPRNAVCRDGADVVVFRTGESVHDGFDAFRRRHRRLLVRNDTREHNNLPEVLQGDNHDIEKDWERLL